MNIAPIRSESDYRSALKTISVLMELDPDAGTAEGDHLDILATLVQTYEARHFPVDLPNPIEALKFRMEQSGLTAKDLAPLIGSTSRVYEILNGTRPLTLRMIRSLHQGLNIPAEALIKEPRLAAA